MKKINIAIMVLAAVLFVGCQQVKTGEKMDSGMASDTKTGMTGDTMKKKMDGDMGTDMKTGMDKSSMTPGMTGSMYTRPDDKTLRQRLTPMQYKVSRQNGTEPPFNNEYWNNHEAGIYTDIVSGEPLFSSTDKFNSGTGWPSFTRPLESENIVEKADRSLWTVRTEVRSRHGDSELTMWRNGNRYRP